MFQSNSRLLAPILFRILGERLTYVIDIMLNDKITIIVNLQYRKGFLVLVSKKKGMEILYYFKLFNANYKKIDGLEMSSAVSPL